MNAIRSSARNWFTVALVLTAAPIRAQTISIVSVDAAVPDIGTVASATNGDTIFRIAADSGAVTRLSGVGARTSSGTTRGHVTVTCTGSDTCASASDTVTITGFGSPSGRALALTNFTIAAGVNPPTLGTPTGTGTVSFTVSGIPRDEVRDFYIGADLGIAATGNSGAATSGFVISLPAGSMNGSAHANVLRPISLSKVSDLSFGSIAAPSSGTATVTFSAVDAALEVTGAGARALSGTSATLAQYTVTGEGGQSFSIDMNVETPVMLNGPGSLSVMLNSNADASPVLSGSAGAEGSYSFRVGGSFSLSHDAPAGAYSGNFVVTVLYN